VGISGLQAARGGARPGWWGPPAAPAFRCAAAAVFGRAAAAVFGRAAATPAAIAHGAPVKKFANR
jgi:hypothetical protein